MEDETYRTEIERITSARTVWISNYRWIQLPYELRDRMLEVLDKEEIVERYAGNVANDLYMRGYVDLGFELLRTIDAVLIRKADES
jgi:hypothetical protein